MKILCAGIMLIGLLPAWGASLETNNVVLAPHRADLVVLQGDHLAPFKSDAFLRAPWTVLYFGAGWCSDCRRFSPALVEAYNREPKGEKQFEVLLLTMDKSEQGMLQFMRTEKMPWPALAFNKLDGAKDLKRFYSSNGIPCLTIIDRKGEVVLQSKSDQDGKDILQQFEELLKRK